MNILQLIENTENSYKKKASTFGGEYSGPCPFCGGDDRFSIHPNRDHYVCRQCKKAGDSIKFLRDYHNKTYFEACSELNISPQINYQSLDTAVEKPGQNEIVWKPRIIENPSEIWQNKAAAFLFETYKFLLSSSGKQYRNWLNARGISNNTIKSARMGWNICSVSFDRESWGLTPEKDQSGKNKQIWIPEGLIIPQFYNEKLIRLRIRQSDPITTDRFIMVPGSSMGYFDYAAHLGIGSDRGKSVLITEAELDGWLLQQELSDIFRVYAIGNVSARPDQAVHDCLIDTAILLNLDDDQAGRNEGPWWDGHYPGRVLPWFADFGKDVGESFEVGIDIRAWGEDGLHKLQTIMMPTQKKIISIKQQNFKDAIYKKFDSQKSIKNQKQPEIKSFSIPPVKQKSNKTNQAVCVHNLYCQSLKNKICLIDKQNIYSDIKICPKEQWYPYTTGVITEIILSPGVHKL